MKRLAVCVVLFLSVCAAGVFAGETVSLAGKWRFALDQRKVGAGEEWFKKDLAETIKLPGTIDDAGFGPTNTEKATLAGPRRVRDYAGPVWYQRDIEIPANWQGKRVTLLLERCRWVTQVWLDDKRIGTQDSLIAPHIYDLGTGVVPGKHRLTVCVDNTVKIDLGVFVSALFGGTPGNMNGIIGRIELAATPPVWLDDVQVYPDVDKKIATVKARIGNATGKAGKGTLKADAKTAGVTWDEKGCTAAIEVDMSGAKLWDEFEPNLSEVTVTLDAGNGATDERRVTFGMRKFKAKGTQFCINGRPIFLRGTLECQVFPLTGYPPMDVPAWQRIYRIIKSYGLNHMRFHSWCPPEAAFAAADIEGIMIQAEGPMANVSAGSDPARDAFIEAEFKRIVAAYGNHPSFCLMTFGNEYGGKKELLTSWLDMLVNLDSRHLYSSASNAQRTENRQFTVTPDGRGVHGQGTAGDVGKVVAGDSRPVIGHEIGQWMFFPNYDEVKKYTGVMKVDNFEIIRNDLKAKGLFNQYPEIYQAVGRQAILLYKEEMELLLRTQGYAGFQLLDLHDYPTQGTALIGLLDPFWESKGFITPEKHRQYCNTVVPLLRMPKRTYTVDEVFTGAVELTSFGQKDLKDIQPQWSIKDEGGMEVAGGALPVITAPTGKLSSLGMIEASLAKAKAPCKLTVKVSLKGTEFANEWEIWAYPAAVQASAPADFVVSRKWDEAAKSLADGKKVILFPDKMNSQLAMKGKFMPVFWSPVWFPTQKPNTMSLLCDPKHPAFAAFPTEFYSNWQWYDLINNSLVVTLNDAPASLRPIVQMIDNFARNNRMGCVFEGLVGKGKLLLCTIKLPDMAEKNPVARQLLKSFFDYAGSDKFNPAVELAPELLEKLCSPSTDSRMVRLGAKVLSADSQAVDNPASNAIDGDDSTVWHTSWKPMEDPMPHQLVIDLGKEVALKGITYLPRQDMVNGRIASYEVYAGNDEKVFSEASAKGMWKKGDELQTVLFKTLVKGRYLKVVAKSEVQGKSFAAIAELDVMLDETYPMEPCRFQDPKAPVEERVADVLGRLTQDEKLLLIGGDQDGFSTYAIPRLGIPKLVMADGPQGVRNYGAACHFPCGSALAATWDVTLAERYGRALGLEARARGVHYQLGPGINICRIPINGRNFEYFGEDPLLTGSLVVAWIRGLQGEGVAATVKHFACNNQENHRYDVDVVVDDRTLHEIYLPAFKRAIQEGGSWAIMSAYNRLQGDYCAGNDKLQKQILKKEWGFRGVVMSDWGACHNVTYLAKGLDLEMPRHSQFSTQNVVRALAQGTVKQEQLDEAVRRNLRVIFAMGFFDRPQKRSGIPTDCEESRRTALDVARAAIVLLKNEKNALPLDRKVIRRIAVYGPNAQNTPRGGGGSGDVDATHNVGFLAGIRALAGAEVEVKFATLPDMETARGSDAAIVCVGLDRSVESESKDRPFELPTDQQNLIAAVAAANPRTIVVINGGAAVGMEGWIGRLPAVLQAWFLGQEGGTALGEVLFGDVNPSGRLCSTFDRRLEDNPAAPNYPGVTGPGQSYPVEPYKEGIFYGYRGYDKSGTAPLFPFGYGLSYTTFKFSRLKVKKSGESVKVSVDVKNTGKRAGAEVVQVYVGDPVCSVERPLRELKGFAKVMLQPGEKQRVEINLAKDAFAFYDVKTRAWIVEPGKFVIEAGRSERDILCSDTVKW